VVTSWQEFYHSTRLRGPLYRAKFHAFAFQLRGQVFFPATDAGRFITADWFNSLIVVQHAINDWAVTNFAVIENNAEFLEHGVSS